MSDINISALRMKYKEKKDAFLECNIQHKEPFSLFKEWLDVALTTEEILEPNAASLATVNKNGQPSNRFVLLKDFTNSGFTFFTNYGSRKAHDIEDNPNVAMTIYWCPLRRSVRIEGIAEKITKEESLKYWVQRPRASRIGALASAQSDRIPNRNYLDNIEKNIKTEVGDDGDIPMPNWGGYLIKPRLIEFWQGQTDRLHDRIRFRCGNDIEKEVDNNLTYLGQNGWVYERLAP